MNGECGGSGPHRGGGPKHPKIFLGILGSANRHPFIWFHLKKFITSYLRFFKPKGHGDSINFWAFPQHPMIRLWGKTQQHNLWGPSVPQK